MKNDNLKDELKTKVSSLANTYYSNYRLTKSTLKRHAILKKLHKNKDIIICRPDKGNYVVIIDQKIYIDEMSITIF